MISEIQKKKIQKKKIQKVHLLGSMVGSVIIVIIGLCFVFGCNSSEPGNTQGLEQSVGQGISSEDAVKLAQQRVQTDGVMSVDGRIAVVEEEQNYWHVSFPLSSPKVFGGEPHVLIDKTSGAITKIYYTQ